MGRTSTKVSRTRSTPKTARVPVGAVQIKWSVLVVDGQLNVVGALQEGLPLSNAIKIQEDYNNGNDTGCVATVAPTDQLHNAILSTDWSINKAEKDLASFTMKEITHRFYRIHDAEEHVQTLADLGAIARSLEDTAKGLRGHDDFLNGYDNLEASPKVLERLGYKK